jgi:ABC-type branched-subunit amino acid transport system substrate-binding protein
MTPSSPTRAATRLTIALCGVGTLVMGCSSKAAESPDAPGVTDSTITLGAISDLSGPFASSGNTQSNAVRMYFDERNADGGVCGRQVEVDVRDSALDPQQASLAYQQLQSETLGIVESFGSAPTAAIVEQAQTDGVLLLSAGQSGTLLTHDNVMIPVATYAVQVINGIDHLVDEGVLAEGDTVGVVILSGDVAEDTATGLEYVAEQHGLEVVTQEVTPADTDMTAQVQSLSRAGAKALIVNGTPPQLASLASVSQSVDWPVPIVVSGTTFAPALMDLPVAGLLQERVLVTLPVRPVSSEDPEVQALLESIRAEYPDTSLDFNVVMGTVFAAAYAGVLEKACEDGGELSRESVLEAYREVDSLDIGGLSGALDFTAAGQPATAEVVLARPSDDVGGLAEVTGPAASANAQAFLAGN